MVISCVLETWFQRMAFGFQSCIFGLDTRFFLSTVQCSIHLNHRAMIPIDPVAGRELVICFARYYATEYKHKSARAGAERRPLIKPRES